ncbi:hypothetical protein [Vampirovibrio chlorellavorus]|uniref:hypothetical protein n=1 Tax=Vampirovibrio chlorellavorus TaxID=758823 RepID=UPI0026EA759A|nr:hypothetical protein [Vampirovibrio chlorellavorus]
MVGSVINCKRCNKIFQKVTANEHCPACIRLEEEEVTKLYRRLQKSSADGGITIDELSVELEISVETIERYYLEGKLTTGVMFLKTACQGCGAIIREIQRKGRFCVTCSEETANKAGVEVKYMQTIQKEEEAERRRQEQLQLLKKNQPSKTQPRKFGFSRSGF